MNEIDYKKIIQTKINQSTGMKGVELSLSIMTDIGPVIFEFGDYWNSLTELIESGEVIEMEYIVSSMDYRTKSIYFPKGTVFTNSVGVKK